MPRRSHSSSETTKGAGVGVYSPASDSLTAYRVGPDGSAAHSDCSYFAPTARFAVQPGKTFSYVVYVAVGKTDNLRLTFQRIAEAAAK